MLARDERERLLAAVIDLYAEGGSSGAVGEWAEETLPALGEGLPEVILSEEDRDLVEVIDDALARIVAAASAKPDLPPPSRQALIGALGGADMLMRAEILTGGRERLLNLLPTFAYVATSLFLEQGKALRLSQRARELVQEAEHR